MRSNGPGGGGKAALYDPPRLSAGAQRALAGGRQSMLRERQHPGQRYGMELTVRKAGSVPAIVADFDDPVLHAHRQCGYRFVRRRTQRLAGEDGKACPMARTDDLIIVDWAAG